MRAVRERVKRIVELCVVKTLHQYGEKDVKFTQTNQRKSEKLEKDKSEK